MLDEMVGLIMELKDLLFGWATYDVGLHLGETPTCQLREHCCATHNDRKKTRRELEVQQGKYFFLHYTLIICKTGMKVYRKGMCYLLNHSYAKSSTEDKRYP